MTLTLFFIGIFALTLPVLAYYGVRILIVFLKAGSMPGFDNKFSKKFCRTLVVGIGCCVIAAMVETPEEKARYEAQEQIKKEAQKKQAQEAKANTNTENEEKKKDNYSHMSLCKEQIEQRTGMYITDFHMMKYAQGELPNGDIDTQGVIEFNSKPQEHKFWARFRGDKMIRLKIDSQLIFDETK